MAIVSNTYLSYSAKGIREDLANVIYDISPEETPFISNIGKESAKQTFYEWQTDALAAASTSNAVVEGDDVGTFTAATPTSRVGNYCQISRKDVIISGSLEKSDKAGRKSEMAYQLAKRGKELKRDMESILLYNQAANAGSSSVARLTAGLPAFLRTNTNYYTTDGGNPTVSNGVVNAARTDGTQRSFTETILKDVIQKAWTAGGNPTMLMVGPVNKVRASGFTGIAETRVQAKNSPTTIIGAADVYVSDFGNLSIVPNRFQREREAFLLDTEYASLVQYRPIQQEELAKTGDAEKRMIIVEYGLKVKNEAAHGIAADLTTT